MGAWTGADGLPFARTRSLGDCELGSWQAASQKLECSFPVGCGFSKCCGFLVGVSSEEASGKQVF